MMPMQWVCISCDSAPTLAREQALRLRVLSVPKLSQSWIRLRAWRVRLACGRPSAAACVAPGTCVVDTGPDCGGAGGGVSRRCGWGGCAVTESGSKEKALENCTV